MEKFVFAAAILAAIAVGFALPTPGADPVADAPLQASQFTKLNLG